MVQQSGVYQELGQERMLCGYSFGMEVDCFFYCLIWNVFLLKLPKKKKNTEG